MRTALDTNVLSAIWSGEPGAASVSNTLQLLRETDTLVLSPVVYAELFAHPKVTEQFIDDFLLDTRIEVDYRMDPSVWREAGRRFASYAHRRRRKAVEVCPRRILADFLIGAHALIHADRLMTFDAQRFKQDYPELRLYKEPLG